MGPSERRSMRTIRVAIAGLGAVGTHIAHLLLARQNLFRQLYNVEVRIVAICSSSAGIHHEQGLSRADIDTSDSLHRGATGAQWLQDVVGTPDLLFECGPSDFDRRPEPVSMPYYRLMLGAGNAIIAVSKSALVSHGPELAVMSKECGGWIGLSGAAGAALPGIDLLRNSILGCTVNKVEACLNATSNYILDSLVRGSPSDSPVEDLAAAVAHAQAQGFAERDVSRDIEGWDSVAKLILLANFGIPEGTVKNWVQVGDVERDGLSNYNVTPEAVLRWQQASATPRLVSTLERSPSGSCEHIGAPSATPSTWTASVSLQEFPPFHPFSSLHGTSKGIIISTVEMGDIFASACGPEPVATAASALKDFQRWMQRL